ncbi:MAG: hypothetical protein M0C28_36575 [Candidatus Moduliflexus flocculans]|nr:hypothetical protein [Candidatus Moduliflexus flocculans]
MQKLVDAGLDHVQITVESCDEQIHDEMMRANGAFKQTIAGLEKCPRHQTLRDDQHHHADAPTSTPSPTRWIFSRTSGVPTIGLNALIYSGTRPDRGHGSARKRIATHPRHGHAENRRSADSA